MLAQSLFAARSIFVCRAQHLLRRACPNDRAVESVSSARGAGGRLVRGHMLAQFVRAARGAGSRKPVCQGANALPCRAGARAMGKHGVSPHTPHMGKREGKLAVILRKGSGSLAGEGAFFGPCLTLVFHSRHSILLYRKICDTRLIGRWNLSALHAPLKFGQSGGACIPILCPPHILSLRFSHFYSPKLLLTKAFQYIQQTHLLSLS